MYAYLIVAHNDPDSVRELILALHDEKAHFFVHIDGKANIEDFKKVLQNITHVHVAKKRVSVYWAGWSLVQAALNLIEDAVQYNVDFTRYILLSGACFPVKSNQDLFKIYDQDCEYISAVEMPSPENGKPVSRLERYHIDGGYRNAGFRSKLIKLLNMLNRIAWKRDYKKIFGEIKPHGGSTWWALSHNAILAIRDFIINYPHIVSFMKNMKCPDESFFQTVVMNSNLKKKVASNVTYADWMQRGPSPELISEKHLPYLLQRMNVDGISKKEEPIGFARKITSANKLIRDEIKKWRMKT